jgi:hypothetical protein
MPIFDTHNGIVALVSAVEVFAFLGGLLFASDPGGSPWAYALANVCVAASIVVDAAIGKKHERYVLILSRGEGVE